MNTSADPRAVPTLTYSVCAQVSTLGPAVMATFAAIADYRIRRLCHTRPDETGTAGHAALSFTHNTASLSS